MKKEELKTGMRVTTREGEAYIVMLNTCSCDYFERETGHMRLNEYGQDLICLSHDAEEFDIVKVEKRTKKARNSMYETIWERNETTEMTIKQLEQLHGYKNLKIVKE